MPSRSRRVMSNREKQSLARARTRDHCPRRFSIKRSAQPVGKSASQPVSQSYRAMSTECCDEPPQCWKSCWTQPRHVPKGAFLALLTALLGAFHCVGRQFGQTTTVYLSTDMCFLFLYSRFAIAHDCNSVHCVAVEWPTYSNRDM